MLKPAVPIKLKHLTDIENAKIFVALHGQDVRYCYDSAKWLVWDGKRWTEDKTGEIHRKAKDTALKILVSVARTPDDPERERLAKYVRRTQSAWALKAMIGVAESEPGVPITVDKLDSNPWLLNVQNGTLDLTTGNLRLHTREDLITKIIPVSYDPNATCPTWDAFLDCIMGGTRT